LTLIFLFCPAIIHNSSVWGQIDSFYIFFVALAIYFAYKNRTVPAAIAFAYGILVKPQAIFFGPIFLFYIIERRSVKEFFKAAIAGLGTLYLLVLPFSPNPFDLSWIVTLYKDTMGGLQYFTVNAYNLYAILGLNWVELDAVRSSWMINVAVISSLVAFIGFAFLKLKDKAKFFYLSGFIILVVFCFTTMMHERYLFPAIIFFLLAFLLTKRKSLFYIFLGISGLNYINCVAVMRSFFSDSQLSQFLITLLSLAVIACFALCIYMIIKQLHKTNSLDFSLGAKHGIAIFALTCVYGVFALFDLGSFDAPQSYFLSGADNVSFDVIFDEPTNIASIYSFSGVGDEFSGDLVKKATCDFDIYYTQDNQSFQHLLTLEKKDVFKWGQDVCDVAASGIRVVAANPGQVLGEILFLRPDGSVISGRLENYNVSADYPAENALDESECLPDDLSYYNSSYFDEIYHARTAYEQLHGYSIYETTHPPLGKILISIGIKIFGMTPFGWRIVGAVCGIAMLPIFYLLARGIFKSFFAAFAATCLLALDFMHITQTRIATVDTYVVFFTILTFLFMLYYHKTKFTDSLNKQFLYLTLSGVFMACAVATKWNGAYSMVGLALFFFISLYEKYKSSARDKLCRARVAKTILFCFVAFVGIPVVIYILTFIPVVHTTGIFNYLKEVWRCQVNMFNYHSTLVAEHFFSSLWYTWPFTVKPIWYSITMLPQGMASSISAFGNPLIWWLTPFATVAAGVLAYRKKDSRLWLIVLGFVFSLLPWVFVKRL
ncbi:MAG: phospholipid carrier-dependent glycosyltransferase, partial [Oscillospiraceae bacterium]